MTTRPNEIPLCLYCGNTGVHLSTETWQPLIVRCTSKTCGITSLQDSLDHALKMLSDQILLTDKLTNELNTAIDTQKATLAKYPSSRPMKHPDVGPVPLSPGEQIAILFENASKRIKY